MNIKILPILILMLPLRGSAQDTVRLTLDSCLHYAFGHNLSVLTADIATETAQVTLDGARMRFLPSVSASASQALAHGDDRTTRTGNYGVSASLPLFTGLANLSNLRQARLGTEQSQLKARQTRNTVSAQIISAYLGLVMNQEKLTYQLEVLETSLQQKQEGEVKYRVGRILESDYQLLEASWLSAQAEVENTRLSIDDQRYDLATLIGMEPGRVIVADGGADTLGAAHHSLPPFGQMLAAARQAMPDWQLSSLDVDMARLQVDMARSDFLPSLSLNAGAAYNEGTVLSDDPTTSIHGGLNSSLTLGLSIPLFNGGSSLTAYRQSKLSLRQAELQHRQSLLDIEDQFENLYISARQALNRFRSAEALCKAYHSSYTVYSLKYAQGTVTTVELLQQQDKYLSALNDWLQSKYTYILAEKQLDIYTGKGLEE